jgi:phosphotriesterase-related protein
MSSSVTTVHGPLAPDQLGRTLMHEHLFVQYGGAGADALRAGPRRAEIEKVCAGYIEQIRSCGVCTVVDPTTVDLGRNVPLMAELASKTGLNIICATGIYSTAVYRQLRHQLGGGAEAVAELFIRELTEGIDDTGVRAGIIKVVTGSPAITPDEHELLLAAARASVTTGAPIITHTEGVLGDEQQRILTGAGVPPQRILVGHSCLSRDVEYHLRIIRGGSYLGFDRFGMADMPDEVRAGSLLNLIEQGCGAQLVVSHDSVWYWVGGPTIGTGAHVNWKPTNFFERVVPMLHYGGVSDARIETLLTDNPRRFFAGDSPNP